ncbi:hypothetical protein BLL52_1354 [Rhodoferax antarcticus ANT.BR]|uniref:Uncharacterized protein n=1 Tax=Rhodoferax antarcticus ANT.BR TaxID=1111071 RepID=A0A1Q8YHJ2_9BURK|nr:hypothetical protein BLL52_1354 [Rhodoferax antarcticus ANT.BR]
MAESSRHRLKHSQRRTNCATHLAQLMKRAMKSDSALVACKVRAANQGSPASRAAL